MPNYRRAKAGGATYFVTRQAILCDDLDTIRWWCGFLQTLGEIKRHADYVHYNPVKHELYKKPIEWPYSTLHR